ncbi:MAG: hypothetical protein LH647_03800, partial [Leptolyngbyaceae cyanobacterium CAN_BIN12]|nr:hypothetical protein [Leptolyngbyaceae cyanobacterium CAN_BIN12]
MTVPKLSDPCHPSSRKTVHQIVCSGSTFGAATEELKPSTTTETLRYSQLGILSLYYSKMPQMWKDS